MTHHHASALAAAVLIAAAPVSTALAQHAAPATRGAARPFQKIARTDHGKTPPPVARTAKAAPQSLRYLLSESP